MSRSRIIIEDKIPPIRGVFDAAADVEYLPSSEITREVLQSADAVITRTRPYLGENLLAGSKLRIIATATIGTDHIDTEYCRRNNIKVVNAPGCNAPAVAQYVLCSILHLHPQDYSRKTIAVVGVGHVGSLVAEGANALGLDVLLVDPFKAPERPDLRWVSLDEAAAKADIVTFHTPLTAEGPHPTFHIASNRFFRHLKPGATIINSARGGVVDENALLDARSKGIVSRIAIDCWEGEPTLNRALLANADIATPHIAGYSLQGKIRATNAILRALSQTFATPLRSVQLPPFLPINRFSSLLDTYNPAHSDTLALKNSPQDFELLRNRYPLRIEPAINPTT